MVAFINLLLTFALLVLVAYWSLGIKKRIRDLDKAIGMLRTYVWDTALLIRRLPQDALPDAPTEWAASTDLLLQLVRTIRDGSPKQIVELGSGISTVIMAAELKKQGAGKLVSVDHDAEYANQTRALLESAELQDWAEVRLAPLKNQRIGGKDFLWYEHDGLSDLHDIDVLFIDGPPGTLSPGIRGAALPFFWPRMVSGGQIILDDAHRSAENSIVQQWAQTNEDCNVQWLPLQKGCAVLRKL